jgi:hypothetical protein
MTAKGAFSNIEQSLRKGLLSSLLSSLENTTNEMNTIGSPAYCTHTKLWKCLIVNMGKSMTLHKLGIIYRSCISEDYNGRTTFGESLPHRN